MNNCSFVLSFTVTVVVPVVERDDAVPDLVAAFVVFLVVVTVGVGGAKFIFLSSGNTLAMHECNFGCLLVNMVAFKIEIRKNNEYKNIL